MADNHINEINRKLDVLIEQGKHYTTKEECQNTKSKIEKEIQSCKIWSLARDIFLLFAVNVIAVVTGIKIAFPGIKLF